MTDTQLRNISFGLLGLTTLGLAVATIVEKLGGTAIAFQYFYHSPWMLALWLLTVVFSATYIFKRRKGMNHAAILIHFSLVVILAGASVSFFTSERGTLNLSVSEPPADVFKTDEGRPAKLPFKISLLESVIEYYPGTSSPMDYKSLVCLSDDIGSDTATVSMNKVLSVDGYRFYQTGIGEGSSTLTVAYDPWGITVTYAGYILFFLSVCLFFFTRRSGFKTLLRRVGTAAALLFIVMPAWCSETPMPQTLQRPLAANFGKLYAEWEGRVVPVQTVARDFCMKLTGHDTYRGLTAEQVLTGWLFYYDDWKNEPMIKIKGGNVKELLGSDGSRVSLMDFYRGGRYVLEESLLGDGGMDRNLTSADEKVTLVSRIVTGSALKIFPVGSADSGFGWYSWVDNFPKDMDTAYSSEINSLMETLWREIAHGRYRSANDVISSIHQLQKERAGAAMLPSDTRIAAERLYNKVSWPWFRAFAVLVAAVAAMIFSRRGWLVVTLMSISFAYLSFLLTLQWIIGGHIPMSNGYETMQSMAWLSLLVCLLVYRRLPMLGPLGLLVSALSLLVAAMGESNPVVSPLIPVLSSPYLSIHVMLVMLSYSIFAMMAVNSVVSLLKRNDTAAQTRLADTSTLLLYPAVFALGAGIFVGAVWANQSWGRYWGWDPKETWALVTFIVYAFPLHTTSFPSLRKPKVQNLYYLIAFLTVLMTYFGVNYLLTGLHSYAVR